VGRIFTSLADGEFNRLFLDFEFTAYRLESLQHYDVSYEEAEFGRFLAGESRGEFPGINEWIDGTVAKAVAAGKHLYRVHVVEEPLSDYVRFECSWAYEHTSAAGEDIRILAVQEGQWPRDLPRYDYWLFDSKVLVEMHYADDGRFEAAQLVDEADKIVQANYWRDLAVAASVPYKQFSEGYDGLFSTRV
jgi:hypothetical protein